MHKAKRFINRMPSFWMMWWLFVKLFTFVLSRSLTALWRDPSGTFPNRPVQSLLHCLYKTWRHDITWRDLQPLTQCNENKLSWVLSAVTPRKKAILSHLSSVAKIRAPLSLHMTPIISCRRMLPTKEHAFRCWQNCNAEIQSCNETKHTVFHV